MIRQLIEKIQKEALDTNIIFYFDPPYFDKGSSLYMNHYKDKNHKLVSEKIKNIKNINWIVSYDNVPEIKELYFDCNRKEYSFKHTAYNARLGQEILFFSPTLKQPDIENWNPVFFRHIRTKTSTKIVYRNS